jgi:hypothetical protein
MVDDVHKVIFVSIPRTGGHSITALFRKTQEINPKIVGGRHATPVRYTRAFPDKWRKYFKFTIVRNPFDRVVSYWSRAHRGYLSKEDLENEEVFKKVKNDFNHFVQKELPSLITNKIHFHPQANWFFIPNKLPGYDYVCRYEDFDEEIRKVLKKINFIYPVEEIPNQASSPRRRAYKDYYNPKSIEVIKDLYSKDFKRFEYGF